MARRFLLAAAVATLLPGFTCSKRAAVDMPDVDVAPPSLKQLDAWQRDFEGGAAWRGDPRRVAHEEIQIRLDVPWKGEYFNPDRYEFVESNPERPQWGSYVIRRHGEHDGRTVSYQVQLSRHGSVWYARKVRHYYSIEMIHPALEDRDR